jgi:hypothetical protein
LALVEVEMKGRYLIAAGILAVCMSVLLLLPPSSGTKVNFDRVQKGMTKQEVVALFGREADGFIQDWTIRGDDTWTPFWFSGQHGPSYAYIVFDDDERVCHLGWREEAERVGPLLQRFQQLIHWPWW